MKESLKKRFETLEASKANLLSLVSGVSQEELNSPPEPGKWSVGQLLHHLLQVEVLSLQYMRKKGSNLSDNDNTSVRERLRMFMLKTSLALPLKFKAPKVVSENMPEEVDLQDIRESWEAIRSELDLFIANLPDDKLRHKIFRHPFIGMINISQVLSFYQSHFDHHLPQIRRLLSKIKNEADRN
ncbi:hypothetical protein C900_03156 [Fulvivirga imtechensis AK7]|uniref:DinB-like domain-containing protein n=1 Tax=Fulvivirga imtechensis AK7 TaxID=1237149 RepID=L8JPY7_9BACT|nr:DinB family protein [Fulvivirga imtechensis]ELR71026.1 hypothetical protein C900_03156 [Fulvivirga imtechensis AK7]